MALREDLITSAITFLQDPSVANAPVDKRIAFLQSKNLTQPEIDAALARAGQAAPPQASYTAPQVPTRPSHQQHGHNSYPNGYWEQPPPQIPRRDWRDYFIMATVMGGVGYGLYSLTQRYVVPLIAPPTPAQLEQDKAAIDEEFTRAFDLIDQLAADTAAIKASEAARQERLDTALAEVEQATQDMKSNSRRREDDIRRIAEDVKSFQGLIPKAMKAQEESNDARLRELNTELVSLKKLVAGRLGGSETSAPQMTPTTNGANMFGVNGTVGTGVDMNSLVKQDSASKLETTGTASASARSTNASPFSTFGSRGGIPAWQMAASKKTETPATVTESTPDTEQTLS